MKITELLSEQLIELDIHADSKQDLLQQMAAILDNENILSNRQNFLSALLEREAHTSTGIGDGIAIPHAKTTAVKKPAIAFARSKAGIDYQSLDGKPAHLFFMIAASEGANQEHLDTLARLSGMLMDQTFRTHLLNAKDSKEIISIINEQELQAETTKKAATTGKTVLAVTACPTGIAHTFMAADALKAKAKEMGITIKVETRGSGGAKNVLTEEDIAQADAIIIAADTNVNKDRFNGKVLIEAGVTDGIRQPETLLKRALSPDAPIHQGDNKSQSDSANHARSGSAFYRHLMNGVSHMLPFVVGGGILIALGFLFGIESHIPGDVDYHRFAEALNTIGGGNAFGLMIPVLAGFIAMSIADRPGLAPGMVGGFIAAQGDSGFLGGLIAGFLAGYLVVGMRELLKGIPTSLDGIKTILIYPVLGIFATGMLMYFVIEVPVGVFNTGLGNWLQGMGTTNAILLGLILGGMMAIDMGGPVNKAAYTFGIAMIADGFLTPHAAIMAGGMVPPLGIALATFLFKDKFSQEERDAGKTNIIMGASFITEGAIPFAAADPGRVIPSLVVGSAISGALSMLFGIGLPAPHGGIFVIGLVEGSSLLYLLAIVIGSLVTAFMLGLLKKTKNN
ncbi:PTS system D-fructose-specific IIA component (F1P-forming), Frc family (TC 4.A.2.1.4)/PTS system D-fructose-specific IIB component (F1P-forming), Frc family (TC 4.A.2.1.4)/PTS system D-fructose-specific IIC component (F1P-forming), Frc family (TC 4.A.2.1.4) [Amphibacillus marinus]|uniref:PTS system, fructose-specific IIC component n=1 Tax=Amphibacillus marinus TaxID=872970 RepID=A0A1H8QW16_9BACI|nr:PTS fructose transporter subunit IIABC [Amphibacillus marinus]SEO58500.1 PTS system D-fructose-specific IIA component (F1P-forming), Frc family (TC 4.A.2.1.4)/PTS system D-fructose-specific IIB component (F1P-forming), Frc family (TC 4.A.2.1.4)/PTS system D-fructose-specific IIC component (F1P-forming), Frc family (TC 4.A.2.1.4) [Amphibacillus marinus]